MNRSGLGSDLPTVGEPANRPHRTRDRIAKRRSATEKQDGAGAAGRAAPAGLATASAVPRDSPAMA